MVVSWKEKPTPSPPRMMRLLRQPVPATARSVPVMASVVRTIMSATSHGIDSGAQQVDAEIEFLVADCQRRQQLHHLVHRAGGLHKQPALEGDLAHLARLGRVVEHH